LELENREFIKKADKLFQLREKVKGIEEKVSSVRTIREAEKSRNAKKSQAVLQVVRDFSSSSEKDKQEKNVGKVQKLASKVENVEQKLQELPKAIQLWKAKTGSQTKTLLSGLGQLIQPELFSRELQKLAEIGAKMDKLELRVKGIPKLFQDKDSTAQKLQKQEISRIAEKLRPMAAECCPQTMEAQLTRAS
jgi:Cu/Ag efflux pump CusA